MSLLNSKFSNFIFSFPSKWIYPDVEEEFSPIFKRATFPYKSATSYINATIQSISWPAIDVETVSQTVTQKRSHVRSGKDYGKSPSREYVGGFDMELSSLREFTVIFKTTEGFLNYFIMHRQFEKFLSYGPSNEPNLGHVQLQLLDHTGYLIATKIYYEIIMTGISELELSYASNVPEFRTFSVSFKSSGSKIKFEKQ